ncbi:hypothetical protein [Leucobacter denitrificans]|uniref:TetR family transcriptional regulator n=1 Tax=Leucobacter denitrificans TaxID=683042 RepID=A0A7G9S7A2_9MICO|nr:hypothetical protein [Leucobacter denitrificans]QNN63727.1 hypothetical protein H9L06_05425 [Leucobacter denitrificans]
MTNTSLWQVERVCVELSRDSRRVTFTAIAKLTGIARSTLYRNPTLHAMIAHYRSNTPDPGMTALTDELVTLRATVETLAKTVQNHETMIRQIARN